MGDINTEEGGRFTTGLPCPLPPASERSELNLRRPHFRNITQLKNLILAGGFSVKVEIRPAGRRALLALKRPLGDISARGAGGIRYWPPLTSSAGLVASRHRLVPAPRFRFKNPRTCVRRRADRTGLLALKRPLGTSARAREGELPYWGLLGRSWDLLGRSGSLLGRS